MACFSSWIVTIHLRNTRPFRNPHREKSGTVSWGDRAGQAMSPKLRTQVTRCCTFQRSIANDRMKWRSLLYRSSSHQPWQAIASMQYSNFKCVSRLRATLYIYIFYFENVVAYLHVNLSFAVFTILCQQPISSTSVHIHHNHGVPLIIATHIYLTITAWILTAVSYRQDSC